ncbi:MAG TPA: right-handed parallel beta-helix repeat-containing protein, partial [bacterium]|nr:right-handed parallel beta-helix repeat-containing protein [bacterium]
MRTIKSALGAGVLGTVLVVFSVPAATYTVTNTDNSGAGSFRQAIDDANSNPGADTIEFDIPGTGPHVISPASWFPAFTGPVTVDGYSQPGAAMATETSPAAIMIELDGSSAGEGVGALYFFTDSDNSRVRGLAIGGWNRIAIYLLNPRGVAIEGNYLGLHASGDAAHPNHESAVCIEQESSDYTVVGGDSPAERNVISGNYGYGIEVVGADYCTIKGNYIGTDASGTTHIHNSTGGIDVCGDHNSITNNLISGNEGPGIILEYCATHSTVTGNRIGTDVSGTAALPNSGHGIECEGEYSSIGGSGEGEGNLISGNQQQGINVYYSTYNTFQGNYLGTDVTGTHAIANAWSGICLSESSDHNVIGGAAEGEGNLISGNDIYGVDIQSSRDITVEGNLIGTDATGLGALGNGYSGISVSHSAYDTTIGGDVGAGNTIAHNGYTGITVTGHNGNAMLANSIFSNPELGIDLNGDGRTPNDPDDPDTGPNRLQNFPVLTALKVTPAGDLKAAYNVPS